MLSLMSSRVSTVPVLGRWGPRLCRRLAEVESTELAAYDLELDVAADELGGTE